MWPYDTDPSASGPMSLLAPAQVGALAANPAGPYAAPATPLTAGDAGVAPVAGTPVPGVTPANLATLGKQLQGTPADFLAPQQMQPGLHAPSQSAQIAAALAKAYGLA